jgi:putative Mn2+ efflux pump MntP
VGCIAAASIVSTTLGLTLGKAVGARFETAAALWGGILLVGTGAALAGLKYFGAG